jgi:hypothetical protein
VTLNTILKLTYKYIWINQLFKKKNKGCALVGTKTRNDNSKSNNTTTQIRVSNQDNTEEGMDIFGGSSCLNANQFCVPLLYEGLMRNIDLCIKYVGLMLSIFLIGHLYLSAI